MAKQPLITVIVPNYNTAQYLPKCIDSILAQTWRNLEIILVDDGSSDNSVEIMKEYQLRHPEMIKLLFQENSGQATARNSALDIMTGEYVSFVDSDDYILAEMLNSLYESIKQHQSQIAISDFHTVNEVDVITGSYSSGTIQNNCILVSENQADAVSIVPQVTGKLFDSGLFKIGKNRFPEGMWYEDLALLPLLILSAKKISKVPQYYYRYFKRDGSTTTTFSIKVLDALKALKYIDNKLSARQSTIASSGILKPLKHRTCYITAIRLCEVSSSKDRKQGFLVLRDYIRVNKVHSFQWKLYPIFEQVVVLLVSANLAGFLFQLKKLKAIGNKK